MALRLWSSTPRLLQECCGAAAPVLHNVNVQALRYRRVKHWLPKWKPLRRLKVMKVNLPDYNQKPEDVTEEQVRTKLKEQGLLPPRPWQERPYFITSTGSIFEAYVPPEGDGKVSPIHAQGAKQALRFLEKKSKSMLAIRKIKQYDYGEEFDAVKFCKKAEEIYIKMHECLTTEEKENITDYVTERAYPEVVHNTKLKTIRWKFVKNIEEPRMVHARCTHVVSQENMFAQITVRLHTQQILAVYDRFGRLMHGSPILAKDVLEYVVFEKHLASEYGVWRIHAKIIPDWLPAREPSRGTYIDATKDPLPQTVEQIEAKPETAVAETPSDSPKPQLA